MYQNIYQVPVRSEWSEFSLRSRPPKIKRFQAGPSKCPEDENITDLRRKTERNLTRTKPVLRNEDIMEDSIDYDVFTIAMSYPEGRQRMLERIDANLFSCHGSKESNTSNLLSGKKSSGKRGQSKGQLLGNNQESQSPFKEDENFSFVSRSSLRDKISLKNKAKKQMNNLGDQPESRPVSQEKRNQKARTRLPILLEEQKPKAKSMSPDLLEEQKARSRSPVLLEEPKARSRSPVLLEEQKPKAKPRSPALLEEQTLKVRSMSPVLLEEQKPKARSRSPVLKRKQGRRIFTAKENFEKLPPKFSLRDILGKDADSAQFGECCGDVNRHEQIDDGLESGSNQVPWTGPKDLGHSSQGHLNVDVPLTDNIDAWIEELGNQADSSLLAMLESPVVDETSYNTDTEEEDDDARYYYDNMLNSRDIEHGTAGKFWLNGSLVWGRLSKTRWWPSIVIEGPMAGQKMARIGWTWLMWFGDHKISQMRLSQVVSFAHHFRQHCRGRLSSALEGAIVEALKVCADRAGVLLDGYNNIKSWGLLEMGFLNIIDDVGKDVDLFIPKAGAEFPPLILKELRKLRDEADGSDLDSAEDVPKQNEELNTNQCFESDTLKDVDFCLSCAKHGRKIVCEHPVFVGFVCGKCKDSLMESLLALDNDGCNLFCAVCGEGGELYVCEEKDCGRSFCVRCMKHYLSADALKLVRGRSPWSCFLCTKYSLESHGVLVPRDKWQDELIKFYNPVFDQVSPSCDATYFTGRKLRVLSLFDGIGSVHVALEQLQLDVEVYFASEADANAQHLTLFNHGFSILHLGDVNSISKDKLQEICPIDLVVACPPSEDLDVTNREYEGFNGTGMLTLKFLMILKDVEILCKGSNQVYWLVEGTAAMKSEYRKILSNFFQKEPCMWDAQFFSPYVCPKLYWGNIPRLYSSLQYYKDNQEHFASLESCLAPNVNRSALVRRLRNCAIDMPVVHQEEHKCDDEIFHSSQNEMLIPDRQASVDNRNNTIFSLPVLMDGKKTNVWIGEVEKVLGLPIHYTDVSRLSLSQRQNLLKNAPSVHLLKHLLSPLTEIFMTYP